MLVQPSLSEHMGIYFLLGAKKKTKPHLTIGDLSKARLVTIAGDDLLSRKHA